MNDKRINNLGGRGKDCKEKMEHYYPNLCTGKNVSTNNKARVNNSKVSSKNRNTHDENDKVQDSQILFL